MSELLEGLFRDAQSNDKALYEFALSDLRLIVERFTMNRYSESEKKDYITLLNEKKLIDLKITQNELEIIKYFLVYLLFTFSDRTILVAKCIKVLFDNSLNEAICNAIELYIKNDDATSELIYAIINESSTQEYFANKRIVQVFDQVRKLGGVNSRGIIDKEFEMWNFSSKYK